MVPIQAVAFLPCLIIPSSSSETEQQLLGASVRWAVGMDQEKNPRLEFQGLPIAAASIQKKFFNTDNSVSVLHGAFPLNADMFDGIFASGLVPIFFSSTPTHTRNFLQQNPDVVKEAVLSINARLLHMEHLTIQEAISHLCAKKGRMAKGTPAFPLPAASRKRGRPPTQSISGSGTDHTHVKKCLQFDNRACWTRFICFFFSKYKNLHPFYIPFTIDHHHPISFSYHGRPK
jgi:hypothetical protein